jgi:hypothetical protein
MCTLHTNSWASADRLYSFVQLGPSLIVGADILRLLPRLCRKFFLIISFHTNLIKFKLDNNGRMIIPANVQSYYGCHLAKPGAVLRSYTLPGAGVIQYHTAWASGVWVCADLQDNGWSLKTETESQL